MSRNSFLVGASNTEESKSLEAAVDLQSENLDEEKALSSSNSGFWLKIRNNLVKRQLNDEMRSTAPASLGQKMKYGVVAMKVKRKLARARQRRWRHLRLPLIKPQNPYKILWDIFVGFLILYSVIEIPWMIAFEREATGVLLGFDIFVDVVFGLDMLLTLHHCIYG